MVLKGKIIISLTYWLVVVIAKSRPLHRRLIRMNATFHKI